MIDYNKEIQKCAETRDVTYAEELFGMMKRQGVKPTVATYNVLMKVYSKARKEDKVFETFDEMIKEGLKPNVKIFTTAINACAISPDLDRALKLRSQMEREYRLELNVFTYSSLLNVCAKSNDLGMAKKMYQEMSSIGIEEDVVTLNTMIDAYAEATNLENCLGYFENCMMLVEQAKSGRKPITLNENIYNSQSGTTLSFFMS